VPAAPGACARPNAPAKTASTNSENIRTLATTLSPHFVVPTMERNDDTRAGLRRPGIGSCSAPLIANSMVRTGQEGDRQQISQEQRNSKSGPFLHIAPLLSKICDADHSLYEGKNGGRAPLLVRAAGRERRARRSRTPHRGVAGGRRRDSQGNDGGAGAGTARLDE